jgi:adenylate cyclase
MKKNGFLHFRVLYGIIFINAFFIVLSSTILLSSMWISSEKNAKDLAQSLIEQIESSVKNKTLNYFTPIESINRSASFLLHNYFTNPIKDTENREKTFRYYNELLKDYPQTKMIYYTDTSGELIMLNRMNDGSFSRRTVFNDGVDISIKWEHANGAFYGDYPDITNSAAYGYDPRKRDWFTSAARQKKMIWTPVYLFATDHMPGFTCAIPDYNSIGELQGVSCIDISVEELSRFLGTIQPTPGTKIIIVDKADNLVAVQAKSADDLDKLFEASTDEKGATFYNVRNINVYPDETERNLFSSAVKQKMDLKTITYKRERYNAVYAPISTGGGFELNLVIIIPEKDIIGQVLESLYRVTLFSIGMLVLILLCSSLMSNAIAKPMRTLAHEMAKIKDFQLDSDVDIDTNLLEVLDMRESFESMRTGLKNFKRYVPSDLVAQLINEEADAGIGGEKRELTMFFSDIAHFTSISEEIPPEKLVPDLCTYFELISKTILDNKGTIDKYLGDSVMAFWGAPKKLENHAEYACLSAVQIRNNLNTLFRQWENQGKPTFHTRIGIHTGEVIVGNMGYHERLNYTVIGDPVNVASRLEGVNKVYNTEIVVSQSTWEQCHDACEFRKLDRIAVAGRLEGLDIYELWSQKDDIDKNLRKIFTFYETGLNFYFERKWAEAIKYFSAVQKYRPSDTPGKVMLKRCYQFMKNPPPETWNGVFSLLSK